MSILGVYYIFFANAYVGLFLLFAVVIGNVACFGLSKNKTFLPDGLASIFPIDMQEFMIFDSLEELQKAKHFIFLEYFIIEEGIVWDKILQILKEKVKEGVDVRVIYDDVGCVMKLPYRYEQKLESYGIKCKVFSPFIPLFTNKINNRDHRNHSNKTEYL